jgi:hypothetical protein
MVVGGLAIVAVVGFVAAGIAVWNALSREQ